MPLDGLFLACLREELAQNLIDARITRVHQPGRRELSLAFRSPGQNQLLLISAHPQMARVHLTSASRENPLKPPPFCMLLRKYWEGGRLVKVSQPDLERILVLETQNMDEFGLVSTTQLICEFMGKHSNAILVKKDKGGPKKILGSLITVSPEMSRVRTVRAGEAYTAPPPQEKFFPGALEENKALFRERLDELSEKSLKNTLVSLIQGIGPLTAEALLEGAGLDPGRKTGDLHREDFLSLWDSLMELNKIILEKNFSPTLLRGKDGRALDFTALPLPGREAGGFADEAYQSPSLLLDRFYGDRERLYKEAELKSLLEQRILKELERLKKKLARQQQELERAKKADAYRRQGEILTAYLYRLKKGDSFALLPDIYDPGGEDLKIPLNPSLTPAQNAQVYFKKYKKALSARKELSRRTRLTEGEVRYLEGLHFQLEGAGTEELPALREELAREGYLKTAPGKKARPGVPGGEPLKFLSSDGLNIYVGKNNRQNDFLTLKKAGRDHLWFHAKDIPGSHVVVSHAHPPYKTLEEAAMLAAYYSRGQKSANVPVDYTPVKNVRKPRGAKPGMVIYDNHKTLYVTPGKDKLPRPISSG